MTAWHAVVGVLTALFGIALTGLGLKSRRRWMNSSNYDYNSRNMVIAMVFGGLSFVVAGVRIAFQGW